MRANSARLPSVLTLSFESLPVRLLNAVLVLALVMASLIFLFPSTLEFPMDDPYIHFVYAGNLVEYGKLFFNFPGEHGVGSSSILWVLLLAGGSVIGLSMPVLAKILGVASLAVVGVCVNLLLRPVWHPLPAFVAALLVVLSGNMIWFSLSGMEITLFLALGMACLLLYREERWHQLGIALGLMTLTRPEGLALALAIGLLELGRQKRLTRGLMTAAFYCALICIPWFLYLLWRTGHILPTSAVGKHQSLAIGLEVIAERVKGNSLIVSAARFAPLAYLSAWISYLLVFALGGMTFPGPSIPIGEMLGAPYYTLSVWAVLGWLLIVFPLFFVMVRKMIMTRQWRSLIQDSARRSLILLLAWFVLHNLSYMAFMPIPGTASRYSALNHIILWVGLAIGLLGFVRRPGFLLLLGGGLLAITAANLIYWNKVYDANLLHMKSVRVAAAHFLRDNFTSGEQCAAFDVGAMHYFSGRPIVDMGGLVDPDFGEWYKAGEVDRYLVENRVTCVILPGDTGAIQEGWFDFAKVLGLRDTTLFRMEKVTVFEIDYDLWLQGYPPTNNYQTSVTIYKLVDINK